MNRIIFAGSANLPLAEAIADELDLRLGKRSLQRFPDGELQVEIQESVRGHDVYLIQPTSPPAEGHLWELFFLADACRRAGAARLTAVMPYFGYARQDRRASGRESIPARLVADLIKASERHRVVAVDLHSAAIESCFSVPLEHLSAVPALRTAVRPWVSANHVIVAPDLGAVKLAERYAAQLHLPVAIVHKTRLSGEDVRVRAITGEVSGRAPVLVDDMISTGGTIAAASQALLAAGCSPEITVVASHALFVGPATERLRALPLRQVIVTDTVSAPLNLPLPFEAVSVRRLLAEAIERLYRNQSLSELIVHQ